MTPTDKTNKLLESAYAMSQCRVLAPAAISDSSMLHGRPLDLNILRLERAGEAPAVTAIYGLGGSEQGVPGGLWVQGVGPMGLGTPAHAP